MCNLCRNINISTELSLSSPKLTYNWERYLLTNCRRNLTYNKEIYHMIRVGEPDLEHTISTRLPTQDASGIRQNVRQKEYDV